jgi:hypothetical protein
LFFGFLLFLFLLLIEIVTIIPSETKAEIEFEYQSYLHVPTPLGKDEKTKQLKERSAVLRAKKAEAQRKLIDKDDKIRWEGVTEINRIVEEYEAIQKELEDREQTKKDCIVM